MTTVIPTWRLVVGALVAWAGNMVAVVLAATDANAYLVLFAALIGGCLILTAILSLGLRRAR